METKNKFSRSRGNFLFLLDFSLESETLVNAWPMLDHLFHWSFLSLAVILLQLQMWSYNAFWEPPLKVGGCWHCMSCRISQFIRVDTNTDALLLVHIIFIIIIIKSKINTLSYYKGFIWHCICMVIRVSSWYYTFYHHLEGLDLTLPILPCLQGKIIPCTSWWWIEFIHTVIYTWENRRGL